MVARSKAIYERGKNTRLLPNGFRSICIVNELLFRQMGNAKVAAAIAINIFAYLRNVEETLKQSHH